MKLFFGGEAKEDTPVDPAVDVANAQEFGVSFLDADYISSLTSEDEDKENAQGLVDFETNEDDDWLLVSVTPPVNRIQSRSETCLSRLTESQSSSNSIMQWTLMHENTLQEISLQHRNTQEDGGQSENDKNLSSSPACELSTEIIRQKQQQRDMKILSDARRLVQEWAKEEEWEFASNDNAGTSLLCQMQDCSGSVSLPTELPSVVSVEANSATTLEGITNTLVPHTNICTQCYVPRPFHQPGAMQIWTSDSNGSKYVRFVLERNRRRKHLKLCTSQPTHPSVETVEVPHTFESHQPTLPSKADLLDYIKSVKPQQKARELNIRKYLAPSQINRQNKVKLYEGKAKNHCRKDLWRCHSGVNNNRKCC